MITKTMRWVSSLSAQDRLEDALKECAETVRSRMDAPPDMAFVFLTPHYARDYASVTGLLDRALGTTHVFGCSAGGVIGAGREAENRPAVGILAAALPGVSVFPFHLEMDQLPDPDAPPKAWAEVVGLADRASKPHFVLLADPFTFNPEDLIQGLDYAFPGSVKVGGLASGAMRPGGNAMFLDGAWHRSGLVGLAFTGNVTIDPIVAQGCRPVGKPLRITRCEENCLVELDGRPCLEVLEELLESMPPEDQGLARTSLFIGILTNPLKEGASARDYLVRNLVGLDQERGILAVGAMLRPGQVVQFHLRDKRTSAEDLNLRLGRYARARPDTPPAGALLFSCLGRGVHLYGVPDHDTQVFVKSVGQVPLGGFFCNGEIGPVEGSTYLHGYTSCFGIFRPTRSEDAAAG